MKTRPLLFRGWRLLLSAVLPALVAAQAFANDLLVYTTANSGPGSLRQAVSDSNATSGTNTIVFSNTVTGTITLTSGELVISTNATILGPGPQVLSVSGNDASRVFNISGGTVAISGLTIANGRAPSEGEDGGGVLSSGTLQVTNCLFLANRADNKGNGGGIFSSGSLVVDRCAFISNRAEFGGGAMKVLGPTVVNNSTIVSNRVSNGYGSGGGIGASGSLVMNGCTVVGNLAYRGGGVDSDAPTTVRNTIIAGNTIGMDSGAAYPDVVGVFTSGGYNLIGAANGSTGWNGVGDQTGTTNNPINPLLAPLGDYGGSTPTMMPYNGSPVIDQGKSFGLTTDQRGRARPFTNAIPPATLGDHSDIGALELGIGINLTVTNSNDSGPGSLRQTISEASPIEGDTITFASNVTNPIVLTSGEIVLNKSLTIFGPGTYPLTISGNNLSRVFHLTGYGNIHLYFLNIANGLTNLGGGILVDSGNLELSYCQIVSNTAAMGSSGSGGGIFIRSNAILTLHYCGVAHNQTFGAGGGIALSESASAYVFTTTIASNRTTGGFFYLPHGAGIAVDTGYLLAINSTIASNSSSWTGGGVSVYAQGTAEFRNSIIAGNTSVSSGPDASGIFISGGYNLIGNTNSSAGFGMTNDQINANPLLGPLGTYGGRTLAMALRWESPAIDQGNSFGWPGDQRGVGRPLDDPTIFNAPGGDGADIGAYEVDPRLRIVNIRRTGNDVALSLMTMLGRTYRAEYAPDLDSIFWPVFTNDVPGNGHLVWVTNFGGANQPRRFYRAGNSLD